MTPKDMTWLQRHERDKRWNDLHRKQEAVRESIRKLTDKELIAKMPKVPGDVMPGTQLEIALIREQISLRKLWGNAHA